MKRDTDKFSVKIDNHKNLYNGFYKMDHLTISHQRFNGGNLTIQRELMNRLDAVCILLVDFTVNKTVLIEQFRVGALNEKNPWLIEMVAGLIDKDEEPEEVARREAKEEAGVSVGRVEFINRYLPSPGGTNECIYLYAGEVDSSTASGIHGLEHEGEDIRATAIPLKQAYEWVKNGTINNAAGIIALQWLQLNEQHLKDKWA